MGTFETIVVCVCVAGDTSIMWIQHLKENCGGRGGVLQYCDSVPSKRHFGGAHSNALVPCPQEDHWCGTLQSSSGSMLSRGPLVWGTPMLFWFHALKQTDHCDGGGGGH